MPKDFEKAKKEMVDMQKVNKSLAAALAKSAGKLKKAQAMAGKTKKEMSGEDDD